MDSDGNRNISRSYGKIFRPLKKQSRSRNRDGSSNGTKKKQRIGTGI
jgi:hypothetical protein